MSKLLIKNLLGLNTMANTPPPGSLAVADNIVIDEKGRPTNRRGFALYGTQLTGAPNNLFEFKDRLLVHTSDGSLSYNSDGIGTWVSYGTFNAPSGCKIKSVEQKGSLLFTEARGVYKLTTLAGTPVLAGMPQGLDVTLTQSVGAGTAIPDNVQVGYRIVWKRIDGNNVLLLGSPSHREVYINNSTGMTKDITLVFTVPSGVVSGDWYQIYRTQASAAVGTDPGDKHQLVFEGQYTTGTTVTFTDDYDEFFLGVGLYTNEADQGILQGNDSPPFAKDIAMFKECLFYGNTRDKYYKEIILQSIENIVDDTDTITINGIAYIFSAAEDIANRKFQRFTGGVASENVEDTVKSLIRVINRYSGNTEINAYYTSSIEEDTPGRVLIKARSFSVGQFSIISTVPGINFNPSLTTAVVSNNDTLLNRLYYSKYQQPEAVPITNYFDLGPQDEAIVRLIALRDTLFVLKERSVYKVSGNGPSSFKPELFNETVYVIGSETPVALSDRIWMNSNQGIVSLNESAGVAVQSSLVEKDIISVKNFTNFNTSFGVSYESERKYVMFTLDNNTQTYPSEAWVYNYLNNVWTQWVKKVRCGYVLSTDDKLYLGSAVDNYILQERKSYTNGDKCDETISTGNPVGVTVSIVSAVNNTMVVSYNYSGYTLCAGCVIRQLGNNAKITAVTGSNPYNVTLDRTRSFVAGSAQIDIPIAVEIRYCPIEGGDLALAKQFQEVQVYPELDVITQVQLGFFTDVTPDEETYTINRLETWGFGYGFFGAGTCGDPFYTLPSTPFRVYPMQNMQRARALNFTVRHKVSNEDFAINNLAIIVAGISERIKEE